MTSRIVGGLALVTFLHLGARVAAPATVFEVSSLDAGPAPALVDEVRPAAATGSCQLWVVFDPTCPSCNRAAVTQAQQPADLPLDIVWVAEEETGAEEYRGKVHPEAHVVSSRAVRVELKVRAVPAAFLISDGDVLYSTVLTGSEDLGVVAEACTTA